MPATTIGYCFACDREGIPVVEVGAVVPAHVCWDCTYKHGRGKLRNAMNEIVASRTPKTKKFTECRHCGDPVMANADGGVALLCQSCIKEWHQIGANAHAAG